MPALLSQKKETAVKTRIGDAETTSIIPFYLVEISSHECLGVVSRDADLAKGHHSIEKMETPKVTGYVGYCYLYPKRDLYL